ncbi:MAG: efflux RND transporter periplasmic adaptor subunit [Deltaproteobacteria bacterium]|nr:efflux RND transporter periplasmic adaptor subunit [Deltaproteobacteria bacterium]
MKRTSVISILILILLVAMACTQSSKAPSRIYGEVEATEVDVASRVPARVRRLAVKSGQSVKAGDLLVEFEDDVIASKRAQAQAMIAAAESKEKIAENAVRPEEKEQLRAASIAARKQLEFAKISLERARAAFKEGAISQQALDEVEFKYQAALAGHNAAAAKERMAKMGARVEEKAGAAALLDQAKNALSEVEAYVKDMSLKSPVDGEVFQILNHEGELVPAGYPVVTILKISDVWVTFHLPETQLKFFPMGKRLDVTLPALGERKLNGQVSYISPLAGFATKTTTQERGTFDLKTFELRMSFGSPDPQIRPGMTALVQPAGD